MMHLLPVYPVAGLILWAAVSITLHRYPLAQMAVTALALLSAWAVSLILLYTATFSGPIVLLVGNWPAPFGITFVADRLSGLMTVTALTVSLCVWLYAAFSTAREATGQGFYPAMLAMIGGVCGAFLTGDLFNLYVWFEVLLMGSFVLIALGGGRKQLEGALKYVSVNLVSSALFLAGAGILYGALGTLNMADLAVKMHLQGMPMLSSAVAALFLCAFGIKAALFPFFFWLPAAYHTPPAAVNALFGALMTKVGVVAMIRVFTLIFNHETEVTHTLLLILAGVTIAVGALGAYGQWEIRRIFSFSIIGQIGYIIMGLALNTPLALAGALFFMIHNMIVKTALLLTGGIAGKLMGTEDIRRCGGLYVGRPLLAYAYLLCALSLAGVPPLSGFFGKLALIRAGFDAGAWAVTAVAVAASFLSLGYGMKVWMYAFWGPLPAGIPDTAPGMRSPSVESSARGMIWAVAALTGLMLLLSVGAGPLMRFCLATAEGLLDPREYLQAVLGQGGGALK